MGTKNVSTKTRILDIAITMGTSCPHNISFTRTTHTDTHKHSLSINVYVLWPIWRICICLCYLAFVIHVMCLCVIGGVVFSCGYCVHREHYGNCLLLFEHVCLSVFVAIDRLDVMNAIFLHASMQDIPKQLPNKNAHSAHTHIQMCNH